MSGILEFLLMVSFHLVPCSYRVPVVSVVHLCFQDFLLVVMQKFYASGSCRRCLRFMFMLVLMGLPDVSWWFSLHRMVMTLKLLWGGGVLFLHPRCSQAQMRVWFNAPLSTIVFVNDSLLTLWIVCLCAGAVHTMGLA